MRPVDPYSLKRSVYPGEFIPRMKVEDVAGQLNKEGKIKIIEPLVNITDLPECLKIEVAVPGMDREDFFIKVLDNILSITVFHKDLPQGESFKLHEFNCGCFHRNIVLPENIDTEFVVAEYKAGLLHLYLPKTDYPLKQASSRIVVY